MTAVFHIDYRYTVPFNYWLTNNAVEENTSCKCQINYKRIFILGHVFKWNVHRLDLKWQLQQPEVRGHASFSGLSIYRRSFAISHGYRVLARVKRCFTLQIHAIRIYTGIEKNIFQFRFHWMNSLQKKKENR